MNLIQESTSEEVWFTSLRNVEKWMEISLEDYDWHFADIEGGWGSMEDPCWVTGRELKSRIAQVDHQFVWGVISAFPKGTKPRLYEKPFADGNSSLWTGNPKKQLEDALFEIICWDSSATLWIGLPEKLAMALYTNAPGIRDLNEMNNKLADKC